jgi:hypothetical protein
MRKRSTSFDFPTAESPSKMIFTAPLEVTCTCGLEQRQDFEWCAHDTHQARCGDRHEIQKKVFNKSPLQDERLKVGSAKYPTGVKPRSFSPKTAHLRRLALRHPPFPSAPASMTRGDVGASHCQRVRERQRSGILKEFLIPL